MKRKSVLLITSIILLIDQITKHIAIHHIQNIDLNNPEININLKNLSKFKAHFNLAPLNIENSTFIYNVYPNPTNESLKVSLKSGLVVEDIYFVDLSGKALKPKSVLTSNQGLEINVSNLKEGIYILEIASDKEVDKIITNNLEIAKNSAVNTISEVKDALGIN